VYLPIDKDGNFTKGVNKNGNKAGFALVIARKSGLKHLLFSKSPFIT
jgi:hypothetical protein